MFDVREAQSQALLQLQEITQEIHELQSLPPERVLMPLLPLYYLHLRHLETLRDFVRQHLSKLEEVNNYEMEGARP